MYHKRPREQARHYDIQWHRQTGVFYPEQLSGTPTAGVSANTWREYTNLIRQATVDNPAHRFVSPELMTTADMELAEIPDQHAVVNDRLAELQELSTSIPTAEFVMGTPEYHPDGIYNSLVIIQSGVMACNTPNTLSFPKTLVPSTPVAAGRHRSRRELAMSQHQMKNATPAP